MTVKNELYEMENCSFLINVILDGFLFPLAIIITNYCKSIAQY